MGAIKVRNLTAVDQHFGTYCIPADGETEVAHHLAATLASQFDFRVDDPAMIGDYAFKQDGKLHLGWSSPFFYSDGYGSIAQEIAREFLDMGIALSIYPRDYNPSYKAFGNLPVERWAEAHVPRQIIDRLGEPQEQCFYGFNMTWPKSIHQHPFCRGIGITMFETTAPPAFWTSSMNKCRRIVVPCKQNKEAFENRGVTAPISVVPLGVNPAMWPVLDRRKRDRVFTFLMAAGITHRKNPMAAAKAFVDAFPDEQNVRLVLKTRGVQAAHPFRSWSAHLPVDDRIEVVCEESTPEQMVNWMWKADCFVFPSRGEGFGLTPLQAMSTGLPVIVSNNSGMSEYCHCRYNYPIPCMQVKVPSQARGGYPEEWGDVGDWWEPHHDALVEQMRHVYRQRYEAYDKGLAAANWVRKTWTVRATCEKLIDVVKQDAVEDRIW